MPDYVADDFSFISRRLAELQKERGGQTEEVKEQASKATSTDPNNGDEVVWDYCFY